MGSRTLSRILLASLLAGLASFLGSALPVADAAQRTADAPLTFAVIGDYGMDDDNERRVAELVDSWNPDFVITTGDDYYSPAGGSGTGKYDESTGKYYCRWLKDISTTGLNCRVGSAVRNAFFPALELRAACAFEAAFIMLPIFARQCTFIELVAL